MKNNLILGAIATSLLTVTGLFSASNAQALTTYSNINTSCSNGTFIGTVTCEGVFQGNDSNQIDENTELFDLTDWKELTKINTDGSATYENDIIKFGVNGRGGELKENITWELNNDYDLSNIAELFFSVKGGNSFSAYLWDSNTMSGIFNTAGIVKGNGRGGPGLSHLSVYYRTNIPYTPENPTSVPTPAAILPVLTGLLGAASRRKKADSSLNRDTSNT